MAMTVQQIHPVAHLPLVLGVLRRLEVATVIDRLIPPRTQHTSSRVVAGSKPWSSWTWMGIMPSTRWGHGWKRGGCWRWQPGLTRAASMITAWATSSRRCLRPISTRCIAPLLSTH